MAGLEISLLGQLRVVRDGQPLSDLAYAKVWALLVYLVVETNRVWRREELAALLWPEQPETEARHGLRQALTTLRQHIGDAAADPPYLLISRDTIGFNPASAHWLDLGEFGSLLAACDQHAHRRPAICPACAERLEAAVALYRGDFLAGFSPDAGEQFDQWVLVHRERWRQRCLDSMAWLATYYEQTGIFTQARRLLDRLLAFEPWRELAHRQLMMVLWQMGERAAALVQYERCRQVLADELEIEPEAATTALYEEIRLAEPGAHHGPMPAAIVAKNLHNLPEPLTPFVGRSREREEIAERLADPGCRLLTLTGPGGIGKTRLALRAARDRIGDYADGVFFVPLAPVGAVAYLVPAIAEALSIPLHEHADPKDQLLNRLREREMLLVLDNFEHLTAGADVISALLTWAPRLAILVTSRERLNVQGEWVLPVEGLRVPRGEATDAFEGYGAVDLFVQCLRRARLQTPLRHDERQPVVQICQLAEGMPLALEMAAAWASVLTLPEIRREMEQNLGFLTTSARDVPEKHRSMRAVFDHSWALLPEDEQRTFCRLSVFRGGFTRQAAADLAGASLANLSALVAKSLLRVSPAGRYEIHELLRQYGAEKLAEAPDADREAHERHCAYYLDYLQRRESAMLGPDQVTAVAEIDAELDNIRAAWQWAIGAAQIAQIWQAAHSLWLFHASTGRVWEGAQDFVRAVDVMNADNGTGRPLTPEQSLAVANVHLYLGSYYGRLGHYNEAESVLETSISLLRGVDAPRALGLALNFKAMVAHAMGQPEDEQALLEESLNLFRLAGDDWGSAYSLNDLAMVAHLRGDDDLAHRLGLESLALSSRSGDRRGQGFALHTLGTIAADRGQSDEARRRHLASLTLRRASGDQWGVATSLNQLGRIDRAAGDNASAARHLLEALQTAFDGGIMPVVAETLIELAALVMAEDARPNRARAILTAVVAHPAASPSVRAEAGRLLAALDSHPSTEVDETPLPSPGPMSLEDLARLILQENDKLSQ